MTKLMHLEENVAIDVKCSEISIEHIIYDGAKLDECQLLTVDN